ncbi:MAG: hypothetical protein RBU27_14630 [Bacteroidota bacterium]|jgi:hypothetical protein|nr:hypothetical protein [Bacteroidota bacterium]
MRYQQTPISRLSKAAAFLVKDGAWHPFAEEAGVWYRVRGKIMQRLRLEPGESDELLSLFDRFEPLPPRALKEGFREELRFILDDDRYLLAGMLVRAYVGWDALAAAAAPLGIRLEYLGGNSLRCDILITEWTAADIIRALVLAKAFANVAALLARDAREGIPHIPSEIRGLLQSAFEMFWEEIGAAFRPEPSDALVQGNLFAP